MTTSFVAIVATPSLGGSQTPSLFAAAVASLNHVFYAGVIGLSLAAVRRAATGPVLAAAAGGTAVALGFHLLHDYLPDWVASSADAAQSSAFTALLADLPNLLGLAAIGVLLVWATGREGVIVGRELADEVQAGVVTREEYDVITNSLRRFTTLASTLFGRGDDAWRLRRRLYVLEVELAYRKHHRRTERAQPRGAVDEDEYRRRIAETRSRLESVLEVAR